MAAPDGDGIAVWSAIQHPYWLQRVIAGAARACRWRRSASSPPTRAARSAASSTPSTSRCWRSWRSRSAGPVRLVLTPRGDVPGRAPGGVARSRVRTGFAARRRRSCSRTSTRTTSIGAYADIADRVVGKGSLRRPTARTTSPAVRIVARSVLSHTVPSTAFRGFGNPQINWAVESNLDEAAVAAGHRPARAPAAQPRPPGRPRSSRSTRRATATGPRPSGGPPS